MEVLVYIGAVFAPVWSRKYGDFGRIAGERRISDLARGDVDRMHEMGRREIVEN